MTRKTDVEAARSLLSALEGAVPDDPDLDLMLPEYVRAELDGEPVQDRYPGVHRYILANEHAGALYAALLRAEAAEAGGALPAPARPFTADLSFLAAPWWQSLLQKAERIAHRAAPGRLLALADFAEAFFVLREPLPDVLPLAPGRSNAFAAFGSDIPDEVRWLEAVYEVHRLRLAQPGEKAERLAEVAARNAGLKREWLAGFVQACQAEF